MYTSLSLSLSLSISKAKGGMRAGSLPLGLGNVTDMFINYVAKLFIHRASKSFSADATHHTTSLSRFG